MKRKRPDSWYQQNHPLLQPLQHSPRDAPAAELSDASSPFNNSSSVGHFSRAACGRSSRSGHENTVATGGAGNSPTTTITATTHHTSDKNRQRVRNDSVSTNSPFSSQEIKQAAANQQAHHHTSHHHHHHFSSSSSQHNTASDGSTTAVTFVPCRKVRKITSSQKLSSTHSQATHLFDSEEGEYTAQPITTSTTIECGGKKNRNPSSTASNSNSRSTTFRSSHNSNTSQTPFHHDKNHSSTTTTSYDDFKQPVPVPPNMPFSSSNPASSSSGSANSFSSSFDWMNTNQIPNGNSSAHSLDHWLATGHTFTPPMNDDTQSDASSHNNLLFWNRDELCPLDDPYSAMEDDDVCFLDDWSTSFSPSAAGDNQATGYSSSHHDTGASFPSSFPLNNMMCSGQQQQHQQQSTSTPSAPSSDPTNSLSENSVSAPECKSPCTNFPSRCAGPSSTCTIPKCAQSCTQNSSEQKDLVCPHFVQSIIAHATDMIRSKLIVISCQLDHYIDEFRNYIVTLTPLEARHVLQVLLERKKRSSCQCQCLVRNEIRISFCGDGLKEWCSDDDGTSGNCCADDVKRVPSYVIDTMLICWIRIESLNDFSNRVQEDLQDLLSLCDHTLTKTAKAFVMYTWGCFHFARSEQCDAMKKYAVCIEADPRYFVSHIDRAIILTEKFSRPTDAIECLTQAIECSPHVARLYADRGCIYAGALSDEESALKDFSSSIQLDPKNSDVYNNRGALLVDLHRYEEALSDFDKSLELDPLSSVAYFNRGLAQNYLGRIQEALLDFKKSLELYSCSLTKYFFNLTRHKVCKALCLGNM